MEPNKATTLVFFVAVVGENRRKKQNGGDHDGGWLEWWRGVALVMNMLFRAFHEVQLLRSRKMFSSDVVPNPTRPPVECGVEVLLDLCMTVYVNLMHIHPRGLWH